MEKVPKKYRHLPEANQKAVMRCDKTIADLIERVIQAERLRCRFLHGDNFLSLHDAEGAIMEEFEECEEQLLGDKTFASGVYGSLVELHQSVRTDNEKAFRLICNEALLEAKDLVKESIHLAATLQKGAKPIVTLYVKK